MMELIIGLLVYLFGMSVTTFFLEVFDVDIEKYLWTAFVWPVLLPIVLALQFGSLAADAWKNRKKS